MPAETLSPTQPDRIIAIALGLVAVFGFVEVVSIGVFYNGRARAQHAAAQPSMTMPEATPEATIAAAVESTSPAPAAAQSSPKAEVLSVAERLLKEATELKEKGDTNNALARLQEAAQRDPKNASVLAEMATIYESIGLLDRSNETWRKLEAIGPSAGALHELAEMKLKRGAPAKSESGPGLAGVSPLDAGAARNDAEGIPDGSTFGISDVTATDMPDPDAETNMKLRIAVKARPNTPVDHTKVKIQVFFYDTQDNKEVVLTDADVSYEWLTPHHDWKDTNPEVLAVTYLRPKDKGGQSEAELSAAAAAVTPSGNGKKKAGKKNEPAVVPGEGGHRKYLGYIVRIYYNDQLQAVRADPTKLLNLFPPPFTAPSQ